MTFFITPFHYTDCFSVRQIGYGGNLSKTLLSIISARQERSDKATVSVLYALAVELNILQRILVSHFDIPDEVYAELRRKARAEVAVSRKGAQIESVQAQMFGGDTGWQSSSQNGAI